MKDTERNLKFANLAIQKYGILCSEMTILRGVQNVNFRVKDESGNFYLLRLHTTSMRDVYGVQAELTWLQDLQNTTSLILPQVINNLEGKQITQLEQKDEKPPYPFCTLMTWVEGKVPPTIESVDNQQLEQVGEIMAKLHKHAQNFLPSQNLRIKAIHTPYFEKRWERLCKALKEANFNQNTLEELQRGIQNLLEVLHKLERTSSNFGVIHADFHSGNYLIHQEKMRIIDFGSCSLGFYLFDLALALMELTGEQRVAAFLKGYEKIQPLSKENSQRIDLFLCLAYVDNLGFWAIHPEELPYILQEIPRLVEVLKRWSYENCKSI